MCINNNAADTDSSCRLYVVQEPGTIASTISSINDKITRQFPKVLGKWSIEYKLFRENPEISTPGRQGSQAHIDQYQQQPQSKARFLSQLHLSTHDDDVFNLIDEPMSYSAARAGIKSDKKVLAVFDKGMDSIIGAKLQSMWLLRQSMRAEGHVFAIGDSFLVRTANVTQNGTFKFLIIEVFLFPLFSTQFRLLTEMCYRSNIWPAMISMHPKK